MVGWGGVVFIYDVALANWVENVSDGDFFEWKPW